MKKVKVIRSTGNVFRDLGFSAEKAEHLKVRSNLMLNLQQAIAASGLKQGEAAELLGVTQPRVSDLMRGRIDLFSIETLLDMLARLGIRARVVLRPARRRAGVAQGPGSGSPGPGQEASASQTAPTRLCPATASGAPGADRPAPRQLHDGDPHPLGVLVELGEQLHAVHGAVRHADVEEHQLPVKVTRPVRRDPRRRDLPRRCSG